MLHPVPVRGERRRAVEPVHRQIERGMGAAQIGGHRVWIIEIGKARCGMAGPRIQHRLRQRLHFATLRGAGIGPWEGIVDKADGIAEIAFQSPAYMAEPCHVSAAGEDREVEQGRRWLYKKKIAGDGRRMEPPHRHVLSAFRTDLGNDQECCLRNDSYVKSRWFCRQCFCSWAAACSSDLANFANPFENCGQLPKIMGRSLSKVEN
jgi:hypothetical protein